MNNKKNNIHDKSYLIDIIDNLDASIKALYIEHNKLKKEFEEIKKLIDENNINIKDE